MSHELTIRANNFAEFAAVHGTAVWHGLGQRLERGAPIEEWLVAAGMDWTIQRAKVRFATSPSLNAQEASPAYALGVAYRRAGLSDQVPHGIDRAQFLGGYNDPNALTALATMDDQHVLMRSDTKAPLGNVSARYKVVQPRQIMETLKNEASKQGFELETAGTLFGGSKFWAMASDGEAAEIGKGDILLGRTLLSTSCDGSSKTIGKKTTIAVVCNNTFTAAMRDGQKQHGQSHRSKYDAQAMARALGLVHDDTFTSTVDMARRLADKAISRAKAEDVTTTLLMPADAPTLDKEIEKVRESLAFKRINALFNGQGMGSRLDGRSGTAWGWLNSVTEYADHHARTTSVENRVNSAWFGAGDQLKTRAMELAVAL